MVSSLCGRLRQEKNKMAWATRPLTGCGFGDGGGVAVVEGPTHGIPLTFSPRHARPYDTRPMKALMRITTLQENVK